ncbi:hypothetical protein [Methylobacterium oxalidis]|uniref:hypothetical protein n=1 Tax=Methylobacterium oxalidis TaxID=944322 RepID=UPI003314A28F
MPCGVRSSLAGILLLGLAAGILPVRAQDAAAPSQRPWTDPPVRGSAATSASAPKAEAPAKASAKAVTAARESGAAESPPARSVGGRKAVRVAAPARRPVRTVRAPERARVAVRTAHRQTHAPLRSVRVVRSVPYAATPVRYPYTMQGAVPVGYGYTASDERLRRIREAQAAGYIVLRQRSVVFPDGRSLRTYRPYEVEDDEE